MASDLPFYEIFAPQKVTLLKTCDDVIACDLWFGPPQSKILATPMIDALKIFKKSRTNEAENREKFKNSQSQLKI